MPKPPAILLALLNILFAVLIIKFPISGLLEGVLSTAKQEGSIRALLQIVFPSMVLIVISLINLTTAFKLIFKKQPINKSSLFTTFFPLVCFLILFVSWFFTDSSAFIILLIFAAFATYILAKKLQVKTPHFYALVIIFAAFAGLFSGFEENYCVHQGELADPSGSKMVIATAQDEQIMKDFNVHRGSPIGVAFRTHMLCHDKFNKLIFH